MPAPSSLFAGATPHAGQRAPVAPAMGRIAGALGLAGSLLCGSAAQATEPALMAQAPAVQGAAYFGALGQGSVSLPITSMRDGRRARTLIQQYDFSCGSAALATLLTHHYGIPTTEQAVFEYMFATGDQAKIQKEGFSLLDMKRFLAQWGMQADGFALGLDKLAEARTPAIGLITENGYQHFVVIKGLERDRVLLGDPAQGTRAMPRAQFEAMWPSRLLFVVHNRIGQGQFNLAQDWQVAPRSPLAQGVNRDSITAITLPKHGVGDF